MAQTFPLSSRARDELDDLVRTVGRVVADGRPLSPDSTRQLHAKLEEALRLISELDDAVTLTVRLLRTGDTWYTEKMLDNYADVHGMDPREELTAS